MLTNFYFLFLSLFIFVGFPCPCIVEQLQLFWPVSRYCCRCRGEVGRWLAERAGWDHRLFRGFLVSRMPVGGGFRKLDGMIRRVIFIPHIASKELKWFLLLYSYFQGELAEGWPYVVCNQSDEDDEPSMGIDLRRGMWLWKRSCYPALIRLGTAYTNGKSSHIGATTEQSSD